MIGVFDSGSGGLTVLRALVSRMPRADFAYFGDIANAPYGEKDTEMLNSLIRSGMRRLRDAGAVKLVSACNTASAPVLQGLLGHERVIEMTRPLARKARAWAGRRALLLATPATVSSQAYQDALGVILQLEAVAIPGLAGKIEFGAPKQELSECVKNALAPYSSTRYDMLILACTHYPLIKNVFEQVTREIWGTLNIIDPADAVAEEVETQFHEEGRGKIMIQLSKDSTFFRNRFRELFPDKEASITADT
ncbi:MAG: hypothetical protein RIQ56_251 [Candidatus Parcubacteria bacterium]|jgi:glutamate racemase